MNHLQIAKKLATAEQQDDLGSIANSLIAIAEQLEIKNKKKQQIYEEGYFSACAEFQAIIEEDE